MKILMINPNSSQSITEKLLEASKHYFSEMIIDVVSCPNSPREIVSLQDELIAGMEAVHTLQEKGNDYDSAIIGCFADPGLKAARETSAIPVTGFFESSVIFAKLQGLRYSIIASGDYRDISPWYSTIQGMGEQDNVVSIRCIGLGVNGAVSAKEEVLRETIEKCKYEDGADVVILGCAAFAGRAEALSGATGLPVIDGIRESILIAESMAKYKKEAFR